MKLALADTRAVVHDGPLPDDFFAESRLAARRALVRPDSAVDVSSRAAARGDDVPVRRRRRRHGRVVDPERVRLVRLGCRRAGDGHRAPESRRRASAREPGHPNELAPASRPFHTIIPGMLLEDGELLGPFGVMGGPMQPQGHFQVVRRVVDDADDPQAALDAPRWRVEEDGLVELEPGLEHLVPDLRARGHDARVGDGPASVRSGADDPAPRAMRWSAARTGAATGTRPALCMTYSDTVPLP